MLNRDTIRQCAPYSFDEQLAEQKGLAADGAFTDEYFALQARYAEALFAMLNERLELRALDESFSQLDLRFLPERDDQSVYQQVYAYGMSFLFLRNNLSIEVLSEGDIDTLREGDAEQVSEMVCVTYPQVVTLARDADADVIILYDGSGTGARNDAIVLGFAHAREYDEHGDMIDPNREAEKIEFLEGCLPALAEAFTDTLGHAVAILSE